MTSRRGAIYQERMFTSNRPVPRRQPADPNVDPLEGRRQWTEEGHPLFVWASFALAPVEREWEPLRAGQEAVWVSGEGQVMRVALVDVATGIILDWRRESGSAAYRQRPARAAPDLHPLERLHHRRGRRR